MASCLLCASPRSIGLLCTAHGVSIASPGITSEQIFSRVQPGAASLVDAWGCSHPLADGTKIGRDQRADMAVLHASVSSEHAAMKLDGATWHIVDNASRNGTEVDNQRITDAPVTNGSVIRLGDVRFYFWPDALPRMESPRGAGRTAPTRRDELVFSARVVTPRGHELDLRQRVDGGVLRIGDASIELAAMEFGLLQLLVERRRLVTDAELAYGVAWHEIADALAFKSVQGRQRECPASSCRAPRAPQARHRASRRSLIESKRGVGYRLAGAAG